MRASLPPTSNGSRRTATIRSAYLDRAFHAGQVAAENHELVAADPGGQVAGPHHGPQARRHHADHLVTGRVAERVVHLLEAVEVNVDHAD